MILKPKSQNQIKSDYDKLSPSEKADLFLNVGYNYFGASISDFLRFIYKNINEGPIRMVVFDAYIDIADDKEDTFEWFKANVPEHEQIEFISNYMGEDNYEKFMSFFIPGFLDESLTHILKPKQQAEIDEELKKILDVEGLRNSIDKYKKGWVLALYQWESDDDNVKFYSTSSSTIKEEVFKDFIESAMEAVSNNWRRILCIYQIAPMVGGKFVSNGFSYGGVEILAHVDITESYDEERKLSIDFLSESNILKSKSNDDILKELSNLERYQTLELIEEYWGEDNYKDFIISIFEYYGLWKTNSFFSEVILNKKNELLNDEEE